MIIGIDLGTTNSAVGVWRGGRAELIPNSLGHVLTPSVVGLSDSGEVLVGLGARERLSTHPDKTTGAFKRYMGSQRETRLGKRIFSPEELSAAVLQRLKVDAEAFLGETVTEAVIAVPAYFNDKQRKATRRAGEIAGLKVERLLNEPTAAALSYGVHQLDKDAKVLVFDLGGGTFDVSILEVFEGIIEVRASTGDNRLGGEDFNEVLVRRALERFAKDWKGAGEDHALLQKVRVAAERARRDLTDNAETVMSVIWRDKAFETPVSAEDFEAGASKLLDRLREPVLRALRDSNLRAEELDQIILVGGATRMPVVRRAVTRMFGRFPAATVNPDEAVALGAAVQAGLKARDADLKEVVLTDVCPYSLGVEVGERKANGDIRTGIFSPILERNTVIPASRVETYHPMQPGQRQIELKIYQGESRDVHDNVYLGQITAPLPPGRMDELSVECRFTYDINGLLEVDVHVPKTGERRQLVIMNDETVSKEDLEKQRAALAKLKIHPRDEDVNQAAMARANRCYEDFLGHKRDYVGNLISEFSAVLDGQEPRAIADARKGLLSALDELEGQTFL